MGALTPTFVEHGPSSLHRGKKAQRQADDSKAGSHVGRNLGYLFPDLSSFACFSLLVKWDTHVPRAKVKEEG